MPALPSQSPILLLSYPARCKDNMNVNLLEKRGRDSLTRKAETKTKVETKAKAEDENKMREEQREAAAKIIQACARRYISKNLLKDYRAALNTYKAAQQGLTAITEKLERRCAGPKYTSQPSS